MQVCKPMNRSLLTANHSSRRASSSTGSVALHEASVFPPWSKHMLLHAHASLQPPLWLMPLHRLELFSRVLRMPRPTPSSCMRRGRGQVLAPQGKRLRGCGGACLIAADSWGAERRPRRSPGAAAALAWAAVRSKGSRLLCA